MILVNGQSSCDISLLDRSVHYGDGCFTTMLVKYGKIVNWEAHLQRLQENVQTLYIDGVNWQDLYRWAIYQATTLNSLEKAVMKIIITRGEGGRGYGFLGCKTPNVIISSHEYPIKYTSWCQHGISLVKLNRRLGLSSLGGTKHLNRLEQVLLKQEVDALNVDEGVALDLHDNIVETTASNIFWRKEHSLFTPSLCFSGVKGTMREQVIKIAEKLNYSVAQISAPFNVLLDADEIFITNAVVQLAPVRSLENKHFKHFKACHAISSWLDAQ